MNKCIIILVLSYCVVFGFAQFLNVDSLKNIISVKNKGNIAGAEGLIQLSDFYIYNKPDSGIYYANHALQLSKKLHYPEGEAEAYDVLGQAYFVLGDYAQSMQYNLQALNIYQQIKRPIGVSTMKYVIRGIYMEVDDYRQALQYYFDARKMDEENPDDFRLMFPDLSVDHRLMMCDIAIAEAYLAGNTSDSALFFCKKGICKRSRIKISLVLPRFSIGKHLS